jgi:hypothetical protein
MAVKGTATSEDLHDAIKEVLRKFNSPIQKLAGIVMDGWKEQWLVYAYYEDVKNTTGCNLSVYHCLIHEENLCAKSIKMTNIVAAVAKLVNCIRSKGVYHHQFEQYLFE